MSIDAWATILVTATPTLNSIEDYFGIILQIWRRAGFFDFTLPTETSWGYMVDHFEIVDIELEQVKKDGLCPNLHPWRNDHTNAEMITMNNETITRRIFWYMDGAVPPRRALLDWSLRTGIKWWLMHPSAMRKIKTDTSRNRLGGEDIYKAVQQMVTVRIPMNTEIVLPDGSSTYPREEMPPMEIQYVQCRYPQEKAKLVAKVATGLVKLLPNIGDIQDDPNAAGRVARSAAAATPLATTKGKQERAKKINMTCHKLLTLDAIDHRAFFVLTQVEDPLSNRLGYAKLHHDMVNNRLHAKLPVDKEALKMVMRGLLEVAGEDKLHGQDSPGPKLGSAHVEALAEEHPSGGLAWLYSISP
ncbi:hypothetical protein C8A01DRAFT_37613 [Parachaetomium inaequale]|uniref:Uncharacterized protein n=1 Tax=Parachaetomium inaequale TaxID=2588326 RepID=A0AAN6PCI3_9PEZI|nr:hypothetical protein C8A01DRAFT_37613 [Parachaetomium inaequale]